MHLSLAKLEGNAAAWIAVLGAVLTSPTVLSVPTVTNNDWGQFKITEVFTTAAELGGPDNSYLYSVQNLSANAVTLFRVGNPNNLAYTVNIPAGWTTRGSQNIIWENGSIAPGTTLSGFEILTPGLLPELTSPPFASNATGWIQTSAGSFFGDLSHLGGGVLPSVVTPGTDVVAETTELKASSPTVTPEVQKQGMAQQSVIIEQRIGGRLRGYQRSGQIKVLGMDTGRAPQSGLSAGDEETRAWNAWGNIATNSIKNNFSSTAFSADVRMLMGGLDTLLDDRLLVGVTLGYERQKIDTFFNSGTQKSNSYTVAPYLGYLFTDNLSADLVVGHTRIDIDQTRLQLGTPVSGSQDAKRWFLASNLNHFQEIGNWSVDTSIGFLYARDKLDSFTESNGLVNSSQIIRLGQARIGGNVAYPVGNFEPFANAYYVYDLKTTKVQVAASQAQPSNDRTELQLGAGVRYVGKQGVTGTLEYHTVKTRKNLSSNVFSLSVSMEF